MKGSTYLLAFVVMTFTAFPGLAAEIVLKETPERSLEAETVEITDQGVKVIYPLSEIKSVNGITGISREKIEEIIARAHESVDDQKYEKALGMLEAVKDFDPSTPQAVTDMARTLQGLEKYQASIPYVLKEIKINPEDGSAYRRLGNAYRHDKTKEKEALAAYEKAVELQGPNPVNQFDLGVTYEIYQRCEEALPYLERALSMEPDSKEIHNYFYQHLGRCYIATCQPQKAITTLQEVLKKFPEAEQGKAYYWLSVAYEFTGEHEKAAEHERQAKRIWKKYDL